MSNRLAEVAASLLKKLCHDILEILKKIEKNFQFNSLLLFIQRNEMTLKNKKKVQYFPSPLICMNKAPRLVNRGRRCYLRLQPSLHYRLRAIRGGPLGLVNFNIANY